MINVVKEKRCMGSWRYKVRCLQILRTSACGSHLYSKQYWRPHARGSPGGYSKQIDQAVNMYIHKFHVEMYCPEGVLAKYHLFEETKD